MTIGNMLYTRLATDRFNATATEIATLQARISEGTNDPRPSSDPARAASLSAAREQRSRIDSFQSNAEVASARLSLTDEALAAMSARLRQVKDIALQAANSATAATSHAPLRAELQGLRESLVAVANSTDAAGQPLFSGLSTQMPFVMDGTTVAYAGDGGQPKVQISETMRVQTGVTGAEVLMAVPTDSGMQSVFSMIDNLAAALDGTTTTAGGDASQQLIADISAAIDHVANQQGRVGSMAAQVDQQARRLDDRKLAVDKAVSGLNDLDLTAAATRLSALMTQQQAALQTYSMITKRTLFDFMG